MGVPQTEDRARPGPIQALRAVFTGIGRIIMAADRPQAARPGRANGPAATPKWRSLDKTGNVRLLSAEDLEDDEAAGDGDAGSFRAEAEAEAQAEALAEAELAETELLGADLAEGNLAGAELAETQLAETQLAETQVAEAELAEAPGELAATELAEPPAELAEPAVAEAPAELAEPEVAEPPAELAEPAVTGTPAELPEPEAALPLASYDTLSLASIRARLRPLDADQLRVLVNYEQSHAERPEVLGMLERRIEKLETGG
jgi:hypothetical protein